MGKKLWTVGPVLDKSAPFWNGERAEDIVNARVASYPPRGGKSSRKRASAPDAVPGLDQGDARQLSRLRRALLRRKTLAARQRVQRRIDEILASHAAS